jgi:hypothetical protein
MKHPSGMPALAERLHKLHPHLMTANAGAENGTNGNGSHANGSRRCPETFVHDLKQQDYEKMETPSFLFLDTTAADLFDRASKLARSLSTPETQIVNGYSIKTNPDERLIKLALDSGFYAEAISLLEVQKALQIGFKPEQVILNGPGKWWPEGLMPKERMHAVFCDSIADLKRVIAAADRGELKSKIFGVRLRTPSIKSRFGIRWKRQTISPRSLMQSRCCRATHRSESISTWRAATSAWANGGISSARCCAGAVRSRS